MNIAYLTLFGLLFGSFLNVLILRIPKNESVIFPSSHCVNCGTPLKWYHNIPLLSWIFLRGKCAYCKEKISFQYPLVEFMTAFLFFICAIKENSLYFSLIQGIIFALLLALSVIDLRYKAVPDSLSLPALVLGIIGFDMLSKLQYALLFAGGFALLRIFITAALKKEAMGEADIIIAALIGAMLGIPLGFTAIYLSALFALPIFFIVAKRGYELPFIPFLSTGLFVTYLFNEQISAFLKYVYG
ncbi:MAG: prepilin peptidase [Campylobacteraceae bacterium]|jgi:leader peptidase (prepilin peptidase)/N-methyltransferase|nr:prepilin peptidase [Campylobacteraceae bacterium]